MNFKIIKEILGLAFKIYLYCKEHRMISLVKTGIMLMIFYMCFTEFYLKNRFYTDAKRTNILSRKIGDIVRECGQNSFVSWATIDDTKSSFSRRKLSFNDVVGCVGKEKEHCPVSVKYANPSYLKDYNIGYDDFDYLNRSVSGLIIRCEISDDVNCPDYTPGILKQIVTLTNLDLSEISYVVVKDWKRNLVYVFTLSFAKNSVNTCSQIGGNMLLDNLANTAMENL